MSALYMRILLLLVGLNMATGLLGGAPSDTYDFSDWDGRAVFFGDSITDFCDLEEYYPGLNAVNLGVAGNTTGDMLDRIQAVYDREPDIVVILGGVNDLYEDIPEDVIVANLRAIIQGIQEHVPKVKILLQSVYPIVEGSPLLFNRRIMTLNGRLEGAAFELGCTYVDVFSALRTEDGRLQDGYSYDGLHPSEEGYAAACPVVSAALKDMIRQG